MLDLARETLGLPIESLLELLSLLINLVI